MNALANFDSGTDEVRALMNLCGSGSSRHESDPDITIRRASVVLLVSHFESFLRSVGEEFVDGIISAQLECQRIPVGIRELHTLPTLQQIVETRDDTQRRALLKKLAGLSVLWNSSAKSSSISLNAELLGRQVTSANADKIDQLFALMGESNSACEGEIDFDGMNGDIVSLNIKRALRDVVDCRNSIAHGDISRKPTPDDVARYLGFLTSFARRLQRKSDALIVALVPQLTVSKECAKAHL